MEEGTARKAWPSSESPDEDERKVAAETNSHFIKLDPEDWWLDCRYCKNPDGTPVRLRVDNTFNPKHALRSHAGITLESSGAPFLTTTESNPGAKHKAEMFKKLNPEAAAA
uniref:Uncharacterized protein n=1 Tax=Chromera velia CCMP2878 TaxID=1169474 RepID=A0A0G4I6W6_9ALVE|eukprot:Cvel_11535.t1-p1 / transcript=Cvel_11535.t1 / gene=Cvel_11535 / organism=Chromera_velia_CCMP2878 / gene_product=hypothetical protein / transcript_product=hypothetical protein / location=Cvel_scaffold728:4265-4594(-) / protein_length=110 / sequence_SO=supercontig / SO=protein_coding / is_pseudo=false